jgi:hypothetical protein
MAEQTAAQEALGAARSELEGYIYEFRNTLDCSEHKALLDREKISPLLESAEDWLYVPSQKGRCSLASHLPVS